MDKAPDDQFTPLTDGVDTGVDDSPEPQEDPLHRKRELSIGVVQHWGTLVCIALTGAAWLCLVVFFTIKASVAMCEYVVTDKPRYNADPSIMEGVTELLQCRLTIKNFAWNQHWLMFIPYGVLKELYDLMVPIIFGLGLYGTSLNWRRSRMLFFTVGVPILTVLFMIMWHAGLGQPGLLRGTLVGQAFFYTFAVACFVEMSRLLHRLDPESRVSVHWVFFVFGFAVLFPTYVYRSIIMPLSFGRSGSGYNKLLMRLVVHPMVCEVAMAMLRNFARQLNGTRGGMPSMLFVTALVIRSVFGRFLMIQVQDVGSVVLLQVCISFVDCIVRMCSKDVDAAFLKILYGSRAAEAVLSSKKHNDLLVFEQQISMLCEYSALVCVPAFIYAGQITLSGLPGNITRLVKNSVLQVMVQAVIDMVSIMYDVFYHNIDHMYVWATRRDAAYLRYLALHFTVHGFFVFYTSIFSMFCPLWEGETTLSGLRMDQCLIMPSFDLQATLPQYFLLKRFPNYAPNAAAPLLNTSSLLMYESTMNPAACRGTSLLENCMLDLFQVPVTPRDMPKIQL